MDYTEINSGTIDRWVENHWEWGIPVSHEEYAKAHEGEWSVLLTPTKPVPGRWFPGLKGCQILGLAAGGGQQMPIFTALGAECTVMDYSQKQLDSELPGDPFGEEIAGRGGRRPIRGGALSFLCFLFFIDFCGIWHIIQLNSQSTVELNREDFHESMYSGY